MLMFAALGSTPVTKICAHPAKVSGMVAAQAHYCGAGGAGGCALHAQLSTAALVFSFLNIARGAVVTKGAAIQACVYASFV